jgi:hypothetical protein
MKNKIQRKMNKNELILSLNLGLIVPVIRSHLNKKVTSIEALNYLSQHQQCMGITYHVHLNDVHFCILPNFDNKDTPTPPSSSTSSTSISPSFSTSTTPSSTSCECRWFRKVLLTILRKQRPSMRKTQVKDEKQVVTLNRSNIVSKFRSRGKTKENSVSVMEYIKSHQQCMGIRILENRMGDVTFEIISEQIIDANVTTGSSSQLISSQFSCRKPISPCFECIWLLGFVLSCPNRQGVRVYVNTELLFQEFRKHIPLGPTSRPVKIVDMFQYIATHSVCLSLTTNVMMNEVGFDISSHLKF